MESDEFKALLIEAVDTASKTASELKRKALANALINSVVIPTSKLPGKQALLRVLSGMSDEEMLALTALHNYESGGYEKITLERLAQKTGWSEEENTVAFEGLNQLGLARPMGVMGNDMFGGLWKITALGKRLVRWQLKTS